MIRSMKVSAALLLLSLVAVAFVRVADKRSNILFIIADEQSPFDFKTYNPGLVSPDAGPRQAFRRGYGL